jgi:hypothetical protein
VLIKDKPANNDAKVFAKKKRRWLKWMKHLKKH